MLAQNLSTKVELSISCTKLLNKDTLSKSDPAAIVKLCNSTTGRWQVIGITEQIKNSLNPKFKKTISAEYKFEEQQEVMIEIYDIDVTPSRPWIGKIDSDDDLLGTLMTTMAELCGARGQMLTRPLTLPGRQKKKSMITVRVDQIKGNSRENLVMDLRGVKLKKMDTFGKSDPYFLVKKKRPDGSFQIVYKSEIIMKNLNPVWKQFSVPLGKLLNNPEAKGEKFFIDVYDWDKNNSDDLIGTANVSVRDVCTPNAQFELKFKSKRKRGHIACKATIIKDYSFFEYLTGGMEISLIVSIDFTGSNGNPNQPGTLHYVKQGYPNDYEQAITSIGSILDNYDADHKFPCYGFGGQMPNGKVSHCFALNGNPQQPECFGIPGVLQSYKTALRQVALSGPTYFSQIIQAANAIAQGTVVCQDIQKYFVLLILTDGVINDLDQTIADIVSASELPLSIVIVGVGKANFSAMEFLDSDDKKLKDQRGRVASRDIVQFVKFDEIKKRGAQYLATATLAEIPNQVEQFMKKRRIVPNQRPVMTQQQMMAQGGNVQQQPMMMQHGQQQMRQPMQMMPPNVIQ